ncbi:MAG TPA: hypothetical protein ENN13_01770, partial [Candidatus Altiarchaeales archaeon]|nr:hypothetical protein [Candidatus Altiarchaeales archaeon]
MSQKELEKNRVQKSAGGPDSGIIPELKASASSIVESRKLKIFGVDYTHFRTIDGGDLYVTKYGMGRLQFLWPENWYLEKWLFDKGERLEGTSAVRRITTKEVDGKSIDLVVKYSRVASKVRMGVGKGMESRIPESSVDYANWNSPFEEFGLLMEMRSSPASEGGFVVMSHRPMAIYCPPEKIELWQMERNEYRASMEDRTIRETQTGPEESKVGLHADRQYIMVYDWVKGDDAYTAFQKLGKTDDELKEFTLRVFDELRDKKGYRVLDHKPAHIIVKIKNNG